MTSAETPPDTSAPASAAVAAADAAAPPADAKDYVFTFSYESFADARKRGMMRPPDRLVAALAASPEVRRLLVADPFHSWVTGWLRNAVDAKHRHRDTDRVRTVAPTRLARTDPVALDALAHHYRGYGDALALAAARAGLHLPRFITANPLVAGFSDLTWAGPALYYARDDWLSSPARRRYWPAYREAYRRIADSGRAVAAVSHEIIERISPRGPHRVVPNGVEPAEWLGERPAAPDWFARIPTPRAVYVGTLDARLDIDGIARLARDKPELQIVLVGPAPAPQHLARLRGLSNVHVHGRVARAEVVAVLRAAQLALLAHRRTALTEAMSPLKVYEYLAAGLPVLATDLRPVRGLDERVHLADSVEDFIQLTDDALERGIQAEPERRAFVEANAWSTRHRQILSLIGT